VARSAHLPGFQIDPAVAQRLHLAVAVDPAPTAAAGTDLALVPDRNDLRRYAPLDFVDICTPTGSHVDMTLWALAQGFHVLCEKPVAATAADAARIVDAAARAGRVVMPCHQHRFNPAWQQMQRWLHDGAIGHWHLAELAIYRLQADQGAERGLSPWRTLASVGGGGILMDHGTHLIYSLFDAAGTLPSSVLAWSRRLRHRSYASDDTVHLTIEFADRAATIMLTWAAAHRENRVRFMGERGTIDWQGGVLRLERTGHDPEVLDYTAQLDKRMYATWFAQLFAAFATAMDRGQSPEARDDLVGVAAVLEAAEASARSGARVPLP
jgi:predicted dehydrogenase